MAPFFRDLFRAPDHTLSKESKDSTTIKANQDKLRILEQDNMIAEKINSILKCNLLLFPSFLSNFRTVELTLFNPRRGSGR